MQQKKEMTGYLEQQTELFSKFYKITQNMVICPMEAMEEKMKERENLKEKIDELEEKKEALFAEDANLRIAARCEAGCGELDESYRGVLEAGRRFQGILYQIRELEPEILKRILSERERLGKKIKEVNQSTSAQAARFTVGTDTARSGGGKIGKA